MASRGKTNEQKRLSAAKVVHIHKKEHTFVISTSAGPRKKAQAVPLGVVIRDLLGLAQTAKEAKYIASKGKAFVDGRPVKDIKFPVGALDVVSFPETKKAYRMVFDNKARLTPKEVKKGDDKVCRIEDKHVVKGGQVQLSLNDGRSIVVSAKDKDKYRVWDAVHLEVPSQKVIEVFPYDKGSTVYVTSGRHTGERGTIEGISPGDMVRDETVSVKGENYSFETVSRNIMIVGSKKHAIEM